MAWTATYARNDGPDVAIDFDVHYFVQKPSTEPKVSAEDRARRNGCCKMTLEVQDDNTRARAVYRRFGFEDFVVGDSAPTRFLAKSLDP